MINLNFYAMKYTRESVDSLLENAKIEIVADVLLEHTKTNTALISDCPFCQSKGKLNIVPSKQIFKCHKCDVGGKGAVKLIEKIRGIPFLDAVEMCAEICNIQLVRYPQLQEQTLPKIEGKSFRDKQLEASGISNSSQISILANEHPIDRYQSGSIDKYWNNTNGDDMRINYLDLNRKLTTYKHPKSGKEIPFVRIRWKNPEEHLDQSGKEMKYQQRSASGSQLWFPEAFLKAYETDKQIRTLFITEGEKKADKMCIHDIMAVGIMGIHNLSDDSKMVDNFRKILAQCKVEKVVFLLDADWNDISSKPGRPVESRPQSFCNAVNVFKKYFSRFNEEGMNLKLYFSYTKTINA